MKGVVKKAWGLCGCACQDLVGVVKCLDFNFQKLGNYGYRSTQ